MPVRKAIGNHPLISYPGGVKASYLAFGQKTIIIITLSKTYGVVLQEISQKNIGEGFISGLFR